MLVGGCHMCQCEDEDSKKREKGGRRLHVALVQPAVWIKITASELTAENAYCIAFTTPYQVT